MEERINPHEKDRLFCYLYGREENKAWTLSLYNAVNGTSYSDPGHAGGFWDQRIPDREPERGEEHVPDGIR